MALCAGGAAWADRLHLYLDADFTHNPAVARSAELGIRTGLALEGVEDAVDLVLRDHRRNPRRSIDNLRAAADDPAAIAAFGGMETAPYLAFGYEINRLGLPLMLIWSEGSLLTRLAHTPQNWMFRVSVDDMQVAPYLAIQLRAAGCRAPTILASDSPWGHGSAGRLRQSLGFEDGPRTWFLPPVSAGPAPVAAILAALRDRPADCVLLMTEGGIGPELVEALSRLDRPPTVFSHWRLLDRADAQESLRVPTARVDLRLLGSCALERLERAPDLHMRIAARTAALDGRPVDPASLPAPHAYLHALDATRLVLRAVAQARGDPRWSEGAAARRIAVQDALYEPAAPVAGVLRVHDDPFDPVGPRALDGHEALGIEDLCLQRLDSLARLRPIPGTAGRAPPMDGQP